MGKNERYGGLEWFRVLSAVLVIAIHTSPLLCFGEFPDFILTRVIARIAVPFFLMTTGFFLLPDIRWNTDKQTKLFRQIRYLGILYGISMLLYLPLMIYKGYFGDGFTVIGLIKDILINGTFYHLWYFPAAIFGLLLVGTLLRYCKDTYVFMLSILLYVFGLLGDSYYGLAERIPWINGFYQSVFSVSDYTRNGLFYVPLFIMLGCLLGTRRDKQTNKQTMKSCPKAVTIIGLAVSSVLFLGEGVCLHFLQWQRHDSMYLTLPIVMWFLFQCLLTWSDRRHYNFSLLTLLVYILHPAMIVAVRLLGKLTGQTVWFVDQSLVHFLLVAVSSFAVSYLLALLGKRMKRSNGQNISRRAWTEISIDNLYHNVREIQAILHPQTKFMAVVKANGYGSGGLRIAGHLNKMGIDAFAVATLEEGIQLRKHGIHGLILILGYTEPERIREIERYRLTQTVTDYEYGTRLESYRQKIHVHIKLDTGMHRLGENYQDTDHLKKMYEFQYLQVDGIFTHLCVADSLEPEDVEFTQRQIQHFYEAVDCLKRQGIDVGKTHIQSSYGVLNYPELRCDYARIGIAMYGVLSKRDDVKMSVDLRPVLTVKSKIAAIRQVKKGETVGYGRAYTADADRDIAVVTIGYADGIPRELSCGKGSVLIYGQTASIVGRICMDQMLIDVTGIPKVKVGDVVTVIGENLEECICAEEVACASDTITNELLSRLGDRLDRTYF